MSWLVSLVGEMLYTGSFLLEKSTCVSMHITCVADEIIFWITSVWHYIDKSTAHTYSDVVHDIASLRFCFSVVMRRKAKYISFELSIGGLQPFLNS